MKGKDLELQLGFSHRVVDKAPAGITFAVGQADRNQDHRHRQAGRRPDRRRNPLAIRPPEPYKGKGVRYAGENVRRKEGKKK